jgi:hypothetical protein
MAWHVFQEFDGVPAVGDAAEAALNPVHVTDTTEINGNLIQEFRMKLPTWVYHTRLQLKEAVIVNIGQLLMLTCFQNFNFFC